MIFPAMDFGLGPVVLVVLLLLAPLCSSVMLRRSCD